MSLVLIILGYIIFFISALLQGLSGFGFSILAIPLITFILSPVTSVPILLIYSIVINLVVIFSTRKVIELKRIWLLLLSAIVGIPLGTKLLIILPENIIRGFIGILILIFGMLLLSGWKINIKHEKSAMFPIGFLSGILGASISISGPPIIIFLTNQRTEKQSFRGNLALYFLLLNIITLPVYYLNDLFTEEVIMNTVIFFPALFTGVIMGNLLSGKIKDVHFRRIILYLLTIMGITTIVSVLI
ncbi:MAG: hypothetical protein APR54_01490 [Candidatus Cloacimonas sp. SDB]|nr:MAG: hypothetical protein APR54_01490 [Candidatus Cloacimonas sp. SDB]